MSKPVKNLITQSYRKRFGELDGAVVVDLCGVGSNAINRIRTDLSRGKMKMTMVKNTLARKAVAGTKMERVSELLEGTSTIVYGGESVVNVARQLVDLAKEIEKLQFKGALMEGVLFGPKQVTELSKYPTRQEAQSQALQLVLSPGRNLAGQLLGPGKKVASLVKAIQEKLEKSEPVAAAAG